MKNNFIDLQKKSATPCFAIVILCNKNKKVGKIHKIGQNKVGKIHLFMIKTNIYNYLHIYF